MHNPLDTYLKKHGVTQQYIVSDMGDIWLSDSGNICPPDIKNSSPSDKPHNSPSDIKNNSPSDKHNSPPDIKNSSPPDKPHNSPPDIKNSSPPDKPHISPPGLGNISRKKAQEHPRGTIAVVIPLYDEFDYITATMDSLLQSFESCNRNYPVWILCVVNNKKEDSEKVRENNCRTITYLKKLQRHITERRLLCNSQALSLTLIDCSSAGYEIPSDMGVGYARKIGMDFALEQGAEILACLDGDTLVEKSYISYLQECATVVVNSRGAKTIRAWVTDFSHQKSESPEETEAIKIYEHYLKEHSEQLKLCKTPYYSVALGPTIVCSRDAYISCGGMNTKNAGEDFYFLQSLTKILGTAPGILHTTVHPSCRISLRVPFGTGRAVKKICEGERTIKEFTVYPHWIYDAIKKFIEVMEEYCKTPLSGSLLENELKKTQEGIYPFLERENFFSAWDKLLANNKKTEQLQRAFHCWFDGLKIIRLIHFLE